MKLLKTALIFLLLCTVTANSAMAHGRRAHVGIMIGGPVYWGPWHYPPYYYEPIIVQPPAPTIYIERAPVVTTDQSADAQNNYWYYCAKSKGYYPYVKECPGGWQKVAPQPQ